MKRRARRLTWRGLVAAVVAVLLVGTGLSVDGALAQSVAGPPAISEIVEGSGEVTLSWTAPTSLPSGHTVVAYDLRHIENSETDRADSNWTVVDDFWVSSPPVPLTGVARSLVNGTEYDFQMLAVTSADGGVTSVDGSWSVLESATARNSAPVIESLAAGDVAATVVWSAPSEIAAGAAATYDVRWIISSATNKSDSEWTVVSGLGGDPAHHIFRSLTNGTEYDVQVRVVSGHNGSWSTTSSVTPYEPGTGKPDSQSSIKIGVPIAAELGLNTDADVFKIVVTETTNLVIYTTAERTAAGGAVAGEVDDTVCTLRSDADPAVVVDNDDVLATHDDSLLYPLVLHCALAATIDAGTYYLEVRAFWSNGVSGADRNVGNYVLHSSNQPAAGSSRETATPFPPGEILIGTHTSAADVHYFRIDADEAEHIQVDVVWPIANNIITLHDADDAPESPSVTNEFQCLTMDLNSCFSLSTLTARVEAGVHYIRLQPPADLVDGSVSRYYLKRGPNVVDSQFAAYCTGLDRHATLTDPLSGCQWHLDNSGQLGGTPGEDANVAAAHALGYLGDGINVSVVDQGVDINHLDFAGNASLAQSHVFSTCQREGEDVNDASALFGNASDHGTQVAGVVGAVDNSIGMRGVAPDVTLYNYRLWHDACATNTGNIAASMTQNMNLIAVSVNSWGDIDSHHASPTFALFDSAIDSGLASGFGGKGTVYVWAGGNGGDNDDSNLDEYNNYYGVVAVCAVDHDGVRATYSEKGENLWVCAPSAGDGVGVATLTHYNRYVGDFGGTSASAPVVAGVVAQMRAENAALTWRDVKLILAASARRNDTSDTGWSVGELRYRPGTDADRYSFNSKYGFGVVDSLAAVEMAKNWTLLPEMLTQTVVSTDPSFTIPDDATVVTKTVEFDNEIDFVEYVQLDTDIDASSFRSLRIELESPSGIVSVMSPELSNANVTNLTALREPFRFGSSRHLGERAEGVWTLRVSDKESGTPLNEDDVAELATISSWGVKLFGHRLRPSAPQSVQVTAGPGAGMVTARWAAPVHEGAGSVNGYELAHIANAATARDDDDWTTVGIAADTLTGTVTVSEETDVRVRATNSEADGEWSETITVTPDADANAPVFSDIDYPGGAAARSVAENTVSGGLGAAITATDVDVGDVLVYSVAATTDSDAADNLLDFNRDFVVDAASGQISVKNNAMIDFETRPSYTVLFQVSDGEDTSGVAETGTLTIDATLTLTVTVRNVDEAGVVTIGGTPQAGEELTASLTDLDGSVSAEAWSWSKSATMSGAFTTIGAATDALYTLVAADVGSFLKASVSYTDGFGSARSASGTTTSAVLAAAVVNTAPVFGGDVGMVVVSLLGGGDCGGARSDCELVHGTWPYYANSFTTGSGTSDTFVVSSVRVALVVPAGVSVSAAIYGNDTSGSADVPGAALVGGALSGPGSFSASEEVLVFESPSGVRLDPGTKYWLVLSRTDAPGSVSFSAFLNLLAGHTDDDTGWMLGQNLVGSVPSGSSEVTWATDGVITQPLRMAIITDPERSVDENVLPGSVVVEIAATDDDGDALVYSVAEAALPGGDGAAHLAAFNEVFVLDAASGQISVKAGASIDFEDLSSSKVYRVLFQVSDGKDASGGPELTVDDFLRLTIRVANVNEDGMVAVTGTPAVGGVLMAVLTDPDGATSDVAWQWSRGGSLSGTFTDIADATDVTYTPVDADAGMYLRATATYRDDTHDADGQTAAGTAAAAVTSAPRFALDLGTVQVDSIVGTAITSSTPSTNIPTDRLVQAFTTGGTTSDEFVLFGVRLHTAVAAGQSISEVAVWSNNPDVSGMPGGVPGMALADGVLSGPDSFDNDLASAEVFESASGVRLAGGTKYWLVVSREVNTSPIGIARKAATGAVTDSQTGWSLGQYAFDDDSSQPWEYINGIYPWRMAIVTIPVRSVPENTASGDLGAAITATDGDGDTLTYSVAATTDTDGAANLTDFNRDFSIDGSGQISVEAGAVIDFEDRAVYKVLYRVSDGEDALGVADTVIDDMLTLTVTVTNVNEDGMVTIGGTPQVDVALTATLTDPDGSVSAEVWSWSRSATAGGAFTTIGGATDASYTPVAADVGMFLKASVSYTDNVHSATDQTASGTTTSAVPHTAPVFPDGDSDGSADPVARSLAENTASGDLGAAITATDGDGDMLTYSVAATADGDAAAHLMAFNRDFDLDAGSGQISVEAGAVIDFEDRAVYKVLYRVSDGEDALGVADAVIDDMLTLTVTVTNVNEDGMVTIGGTPQVDVALTATLTDPDGSVSAEVWSWSKAATAGGAFTTIGGATDASYTPVAADVGMFLKASVSYTDGFGSARSASGTTTRAVPHTAPVFSATDYPSDAAARSLAENTASGDLGAAITATDGDGDMLTYSVAATADGDADANLTAFNRDFDLDSGSGQISVEAGAVIDFEDRAVYKVLYRVSDGEDALGVADTVIDDMLTLTVTVTNVNEDGMVMIGGTPQVDVALTATLTDPDGSVSAEVWSWSKAATAGGAFTTIGGATDASYTPVAADVGMFLKASVSYTDNVHSATGQTASFTTTQAVLAAAVVHTVPVFPDGDSDGSADPVARSLAENTASGDLGAAITATDGDGDTLTYSVAATTDTDGAANLMAFNRDFSIDGSGQISVEAGAVIDFEDRAVYKVVYRVSDGEDALGAADAVIDDALTLTVTVTNVNEDGMVTIGGTPQVDVALTATLTDPDGSVSLEVWSWSRSGTRTGTFSVISGAMSASYTPVVADVGMFLRASASYTDGFGSARSASGTTTRAVPHTAPVFSATDYPSDAAARSLAENTASGVVGAAITATDGDGDMLTYSVAATADGDADANLTAFNRDFDLDSGSGQISVKAGAVIDFEDRAVYKVLYRVSDGEDALGVADTVIDDMLTLTVTVTNVNEDGMVTIGGTPQVDVALTATLTDPDGSVSAEVWSWSKAATAGGAFTTIGGATDASYTPVAADVGMFLKASVSYTDGFGSARSASGTTASAVLAAAVVPVSFGAGTYSVSEGGSVGVSVRLGSAPARNVTIPVTAVGGGGAVPGDFTVSPTSLTFTPVNWATVQTVAVAAVDDMVDDDGESVVLSFGTLPPNVSAGMPATATVTIADNDTAGVSMVPDTGLSFDEGGKATYTIVLASQPSGEVTVTIVSPDDNAVTVSPSVLTFTTSDWDTPQTVTVTVRDVDGTVDETIMVSHTVTSADADYENFAAADVAVRTAPLEVDSALRVGRLGLFWDNSTTGNTLWGDSCIGRRSFVVIWTGPEGNNKRADEWVAEISTRRGAGQVIYDFRESPGEPGDYEMYGTVDFRGNGSLSVNVRGRFGQRWGTWSPTGSLHCFEVQRP